MDGTISFTNTTILNQQTGNSGVGIIAADGTVNFTDLDVTTDGTGDSFGRVGVLGLPAYNLNLFGTNTIHSNGGPAVGLSGLSTFNTTLNDVTSTNSNQIGPTGQDGVSILFAGTGSFDVTGTTTINTTGRNGIDIDDTGGTFTFADIDIDNIADDGISLGVVLGLPGTVSFNGGTVDNVGDDALRIGDVEFGTGVTSFNMVNTGFDQITGDVVQVANTMVGGTGNTASNFGTICNDGGGNTGKIAFDVGNCPVPGVLAKQEPDPGANPWQREAMRGQQEARIQQRLEEAAERRNARRAAALAARAEQRATGPVGGEAGIAQTEAVPANPVAATIPEAAVPAATMEVPCVYGTLECRPAASERHGDARAHRHRLGLGRGRQ